MTTKKILIIDDVRTDADIGIGLPTFTNNQREPEESVLIARTFTLGLRTLQSLGPFDYLYLDHDLGDPTGKTGYDIILWLEEMAYDYKFFYIPKNVICVSSNPAGIKKINDGWKAIQNKLPDLAIKHAQEYNKWLEKVTE